LLTRLKTVEFGEPDLLYGSFVHGLKRLPAFCSIRGIMRVEVDLDKCTGHGICESIADDVFEVQDDGIVLIHDNERPETDRDRMQQAVTQCPAAALRVTD
jgi:ferredoxin